MRGVLHYDGPTESVGCWWTRKPKWLDELVPGERIIVVLKNKDKTITVRPPGKFMRLKIGQEPGRNYFGLSIEIPEREEVEWEEFSSAAKSLLTAARLDPPRTKEIRDLEVADSLLDLWTSDGTFKKPPTAQKGSTHNQAEMFGESDDEDV
jgi:hypothetical protein